MAVRTLPVHDLPNRSQIKAKKNPVWFVTNHLGAKPWHKQREILNALRDHDFVAVRSCNGSGKTYTAALATIWWLMAHDDAIVVTTAPSDRQVKQLLWREIRNIHQQNRNFIGGKITQNRLELSNKRFAFGFSTNSTERFQGFHSPNILVIVDEASGVHEFIFEAILGALSSQNSKLLIIGNPTSLAGTFYDAFHKNRKYWKTIHISAFDTPAFQLPAHRQPDTTDLAFLQNRNDHLIQGSDEHLRGIATPKWAQNIADQRGQNSSAYQVRVLGVFPDEAEDTLISLKLVEDAIARRFQHENEHQPVMGVDVARFGNNQSVAIVRKGPEVIHMTAFRKSDLMHTTGRVLEIAHNQGVKTIYVDEVGIGAAIVDRANEIKTIEAIGVNSGNKSQNPERFLNLRAQMFDGLRQRFDDGDISIPDDAELISQLASLTYKYTSRGQLQVESKDQIRNAGRQSPDKADALALAFYAPPKKPQPEPKIWILSRNNHSSRRRIPR